MYLNGFALDVWNRAVLLIAVEGRTELKDEGLSCPQF